MRENVSKLTAEEKSALGRLLQKCRTAGGEPHRTPRQLDSVHRARAVAMAVRHGNLAEAERLRWQFWPERMRREQLAREMKGRQ